MADLRVVEDVDGFVHGGLFDDERDLDSPRTKVQDVSDQVGMAGVLDAELDRDSKVLGGCAELDEPTLAEGRVLAIDRHETIGVLA